MSHPCLIFLHSIPFFKKHFYWSILDDMLLQLAIFSTFSTTHLPISDSNKCFMAGTWAPDTSARLPTLHKCQLIKLWNNYTRKWAELPGLIFLMGINKEVHVREGGENGSASLPRGSVWGRRASHTLPLLHKFPHTHARVRAPCTGLRVTGGEPRIFVHTKEPLGSTGSAGEDSRASADKKRWPSGPACGFSP